MDDDVQYLGTKLASESTTPSVTGITLHVERCGDRAAHDLTFYRVTSGYVNIGRKSGSDDRSMRRENDDHNAVFTCQVVSAKHAKLVLSDGGQVYIVDLHSRHGTHLSRPGEASRMLPPEVETLLANGDVLTFGKVVGAGSYHVSPITVRVELLTTLPPSEPIIDLLTPLTPPPLLSSLPRPRKLSSGRYGLISASCIESDSSHSSASMSPDMASFPSEDSDADDDQSCISVLPHEKTSVKIPTFHRFIRDICQNAASNEPIVIDVSDDPLDDTVDTARPRSPVVVLVEPFPKSRSHSPMEVGTPSPPGEPQRSEPAVVGAWPASRSDSPRHSSLEVETIRPEVPPTAELHRQPGPVPSSSECQNRAPSVSNDALFELMHHTLPPPPPFFPIGGPFSTSITSDFGLPSVPLPPPPHRMPPLQPLHKVVTECINNELKGVFRGFEDRMTALHDTVNDLVLRQSGTEDDLIDLQGRVEILEPDADNLLCRVAGAERNIASLSAVQGEVDALRNEMSALREKMDVPEPRPAETSMVDVRACANALHTLVSEMKSWREDVEKRIEAQLEVMHSARAEALSALKAIVVEAESTRSLKRKRDDDDEAEEEEEEEEPVTDVATEPAACAPPPIVPPPVSVADPLPDIATQKDVAVESPRPRKHARTAMYTVARTAAAMAIGAAATWSALAFS